MCPAKLKQYRFTESQLCDHIMGFHFTTDANGKQTCPICFKAPGLNSQPNLVVHFYDEH
jgi:hypothetical protein